MNFVYTFLEIFKSSTEYFILLAISVAVLSAALELIGILCNLLTYLLHGAGRYLKS